MHEYQPPPEAQQEMLREFYLAQVEQAEADREKATEDAQKALEGAMRERGVKLVRDGYTHVRTVPKIRPNEPCPCGSGTKFKKCCIDKAVEVGR